MGSGIKFIDWSIAAHVGTKAVGLASCKMVSWDRTLCRNKKELMSLLVIMPVETGLEKPQIQWHSRKHVSYQIHKWKRCNLGKVKIPIPNQMLWILNAYCSWDRKTGVETLTLVSAEIVGYRAHNTWDPHKENPPLLEMILQYKIQTIHKKLITVQKEPTNEANMKINI